VSHIPLRADGVTMTCPVCQGPFAPSGRRVYCSPACKEAGYRRRKSARLVAVPLPPLRPRGPLSVYECPSCGGRAVGEQRCEVCGTFMSRLGFGGPCPHCDEPVALSDLLPMEVLPKAMN
jgi:Zn finger protein HypA/HybF involved in hydrogenase expression